MSAGYRLEPAQPQAPLAGAPFHEWRFPDGTLWTQFYRRDGGFWGRLPGQLDTAWAGGWSPAAGTFLPLAAADSAGPPRTTRSPARSACRSTSSIRW